MTDYRTWQTCCFVYFIKPVGKPGPIKIGCSQTPDARLESINAWSPYPLEMLASVAGSFELERKLHTCFSAFHSHGEWFHPSDELISGIASIKAGAPVEEAFDLTRGNGSIWSKKRKNAWTEGRRFRLSLQARVRFAVERLNKKAPDGVRFVQPTNISEIFDRTYKTGTFTDDDVAVINSFLEEPQKSVEFYTVRKKLGASQ